MSLVHMILGYLIVHGLKHSCAADSQDCLLFQAVPFVSAVEKTCYFLIFRVVSFSSRVQEENWNHATAWTFVSMNPRLNFDLPVFDLNFCGCWSFLQNKSRFPQVRKLQLIT